jgi:hypothetical protein
MSKTGNFVMEVEEYTQDLVSSGKSDALVLDQVKFLYGAFGVSIAQEYIDKINNTILHDYDNF